MPPPDADALVSVSQSFVLVAVHEVFAVTVGESVPPSESKDDLDFESDKFTRL